MTKQACEHDEQEIKLWKDLEQLVRTEDPVHPTFDPKAQDILMKLDALRGQSGYGN